MNTYHDVTIERQQFYRCGLHAVNNLLQKEYQFTAEDFHRIANELSQQSKVQHETSCFSFSIGNYDVNVIEIALSKRGYTIQWHNANKEIPYQIDWDGVLINTVVPAPWWKLFSVGSHWYAMKKIGDSIYEMDSKNPEPIKHSDIGVVEHLNRLRQNGDKIIFVRKT